MFTKDTKIITNTQDLDNYIQGTDVYNSRLLQRLKDPELPRHPYLISTNQYRADLIAKDVYGDSQYQGFLILQVGGSLECLGKGCTINLLSKETIDSLIKGLDDGIK